MTVCPVDLMRGIDFIGCHFPLRMCEHDRPWNLSEMQESSMKYVCLVYGEEKEIGAMTDDECMAYDQGLRNGGRCLASEALQPVHTAKNVRVRHGKVSITDGPLAETKEVLAGFYLIDAADLNDAIQIAAQMPPARVGANQHNWRTTAVVAENRL
jgi:hypothetical protein